MIIESGTIVFLGLLFTFLKLDWKKRMWVLSHPLAMDLGITVSMYMIHAGTFSGLMAAATGAMICSAMLSLGRWLFGHVEGQLYFPGQLDVSQKLLEDMR